MRYFTRELWLGLQKPEERTQSIESFNRAINEYVAQLNQLESRLKPEAYKFFSDADVHDGELLDLVIEDGSRPGPLSEPPRPWKTAKGYPVAVRLSVLDAYGRFVWTLRYKTVRRILVDFPSDKPLFYRDGAGFGDWGHHELTDCGEGFLRHEVLFASGAELLLEFKEVSIECQPRSSNP